MHLIAMLVLVILGYAAGENISWLLGLPIMCLGLYMFEVGRPNSQLIFSPAA